jgi:hypothetical protein
VIGRSVHVALQAARLVRQAREKIAHGSLEIRVEAFWEFRDQFRCASQVRRPLDRSVVVHPCWVAKGDIFSDLSSRVYVIQNMRTIRESMAYREREMGIVLEQDRHCAAEIRQTQRLDIMSVDENGSFSWVIDTSNELENRALPGSVRTNDDLSRI